MGAINQLLTPPGAEHLRLLPFLIWFMLFFHLPYMGMVLGSAALSAAHRPFRPKLSEAFIRLTSGHVGVIAAFGLLPVISLAFLFQMMTAGSGPAIHLYLLRISGLMVLGFAALAVYRRTQNLVAGAAGFLLIAGYCFHFVNLMSLLIFPEKWPFLKAPVPFPLFSVTPLFHFGEFIFLTLIVTGAALLFFYFRWSETLLPADHPHRKLIAYHGMGLLLAGGLLLPTVMFPDLFNLPAYALSVGVFVLSGLIVLAAVAVVALAARLIRDYHAPVPRHTAAAFLMALILFGLVIAKNRMLQDNASLETQTALMMTAQKARADVVNKREEIYAKAMVIDPAMGEQIFNQRCTACHSFDQKILGPPYNDVLPKYYGKTKELESFLMNPRKIDPAYPPMPAQGLSTIQTKAVVKFLMIKMGQETEAPPAKAPEMKNEGGRP